MKTVKLLTIATIATSMLSASSLVDEAKKMGLKAIPESKTELYKMTDPDGTITDERVELGKKLYFDPRISKSGIISCNTCHNLSMGGVDGVSAAIGHMWTPNPHHLNSPTVYNSVFFKAQFWDGRSPHLEDQAQGPIQAGPEMAAAPSSVEATVNSIPAYVEEFKKAYDDNVKIDYTTITATMGIFERTLVTPSRFDDYLNGKDDALNDAEKEGLKVYIDKGCAACHNGIALGGTMQPFEVAAKYEFTNVGDFKGDDKNMVKTPTLRNITETAPYFHNGQIWSLAKAVKEMGSVQLGIKISDEDANKIVTFLKALEGRKPDISIPQLPASTLDTPQPEFK